MSSTRFNVFQDLPTCSDSHFADHSSKDHQQDEVCVQELCLCSLSHTCYDTLNDLTSHCLLLLSGMFLTFATEFKNVVALWITTPPVGNIARCLGEFDREAID